jgi:hypothetical protein
MNWKDITIDKIQRIEAVDETNEVLKTARIISILKDLPFEQVLAMSLNEFRAIDLTFLNEMPKSKLTFKFKHNGRRFRLIKSAREMSAHHFIELQELASKDKIQALHEIIGCLSYRVNIFGRKIDDDYTWKVENFKSYRLPTSTTMRFFFRLSIRNY